jgi:ATP-dependent helicase/nuclease subunit A
MKSEAHMGSEAHILVRGIIDLFYQTPDGIVIIDYKTDNVNKSNVHDQALKYAVPMDLYQKAIEAICQKKVCKKIVYFLSISKGIVL